MNIGFLLKIIQIIISVLLIVLILIQSKGKGLASGIGSGISMYRSRRGIEQFLFIFTIILSGLIVVNSVLILIFGQNA